MQDNVAEYFASFGLLRRDEALAKNYLTGNYGTILANRGKVAGKKLLPPESPVTAGPEKNGTGVDVWESEFLNWDII